MKLASMQQRPHAPPVPPRPSRQVVAEALKRSSARLTFPTRQAPPPPTNVRPWQQSDYSSNNDIESVEKNLNVVYDSIKEANQEKSHQSNNNNNNNNNESNSKLTTETFLNTNEINKNNINNKDLNVATNNQNHSNNNNNNNNYENIIISNNQECKSIGVSTITRGSISPIAIDKFENSNLHTELTSRENARKIFYGAISNNELSKLPDSLIKTTTTLTKVVVSTENDVKSQFSKNKHLIENSLTSSALTVLNDDGTTIVVIEKPNDDIKSVNSEDDKNNIHHKDWLEAGIRYSSTKITLPADDDSINNEILTCSTHHNFIFNKFSKTRPESNFTSIYDKIAMSSLQGLPPLPRSLSGLYLNEEFRETNEPPPPPLRSSSKTSKVGKTIQSSNSRPSPSPGRQLTTLDSQLAILRKEMFGLRQLDLSLLSQLWSLNESIQEFRQLVQEHDERVPSPSPSSEEGDDGYGNHIQVPSRRPPSLHHHHHHHHYSSHHHHRPPRPPRPLRPLGSDESPSSEEYGAV
ncbi:probable serine/threonine-protein kinase roco9 [Microplitis mediator]|uniref:probable serine/threonine-protein kinase roco9 n=1 Tax=Microplitis mediator TaxID=375433 RepID=UPI00255489EB|nr:probable serine/threonine-protein kinase roco9 [Microplitis mediator]